VPAFGPIEAALGFGLFYVLVARLTPAITTRLSTVLDIDPSLTGFGLAVALWVGLALTVLEQARRQLAALGLVSPGESEFRVWSRVESPAIRIAGYLLALVVGAGLARLTYESAVEGLLALIGFGSANGFVSLDGWAVLELIGFFLAYGIAAHSLDRLVIGGLRGVGSD
jgi:hypothetical protein